MHCDGRVKAIHVPSLLHLWSSMECLKLSLNGEKALVIFEGLSALFLAHKVRSSMLHSLHCWKRDDLFFASAWCTSQAKDATQVHDPVIASTLKSLQALVDSQFVIALWVNSGKARRHVSAVVLWPS
jgi:hypothetical protein